MVGRHAAADQPERRRQPLEEVDANSRRALLQRLGRIEAGGPRADDGDAQGRRGDRHERKPTFVRSREFDDDAVDRRDHSRAAERMMICHDREYQHPAVGALDKTAQCVHAADRAGLGMHRGGGGRAGKTVLERARLAALRQAGIDRGEVGVLARPGRAAS